MQSFNSCSYSPVSLTYHSLSLIGVCYIYYVFILTRVDRGCHRFFRERKFMNNIGCAYMSIRGA